MKVILINPPQYSWNIKSSFTDSKKNPGYYILQGILSLGTYLNYHNIETVIKDCVAETLALEDLLVMMEGESFDVAGITGFTYAAPHVFRTAEAIKKKFPNIKIVAGGIHATLLPDQTMDECPWIDYLVVGEGEEPLRQLVVAIEKGTDVENIPNILYRHDDEVINSRRDLSSLDLTELPVNDYSLLNMKLYNVAPGNIRLKPAFSVSASRGCPFKCSFCAAGTIAGKKVRHKSIDKLIQELRVLKNEHGAKGLMFTDSTFTIKKSWVMEFCERLASENLGLAWRASARADCADREILLAMKKAGCYRIGVGFESGVQKTLDFISKGIAVDQHSELARTAHDVGLELSGSFILGFPHETMKEVQETIEFAKSLKLRFCQFYVPMPFPGSKLHNDLKKWIRSDVSWFDYGMHHNDNPIYQSPNFDKELFVNLPLFAYFDYFLSREAISRLLMKSGSWDDFKNSSSYLIMLTKKMLFNLKGYYQYKKIVSNLS